MASVLETPAVTPEDLLRMKGGPTFELVDGRLVEKARGQEADVVGSTLIGLLFEHNKRKPTGFICGPHCGYQIFSPDRQRVRFPDVSFIKAERLPDGPAEGHCRVPPDLAVEVLSPNDEAPDVEERINDYLLAGVPLMWVINPSTRSVTIYRSDGTGGRRTGDQELSGESAVPGFSCRVSDLFIGLKPPTVRTS
jgi:Uma2 family endonuclease